MRNRLKPQNPHTAGRHHVSQAEMDEYRAAKRALKKGARQEAKKEIREAL